jgi:hypothetical protein
MHGGRGTHTAIKPAAYLRSGLGPVMGWPAVASRLDKPDKIRERQWGLPRWSHRAPSVPFSVHGCHDESAVSTRAGFRRQF